MNSEDYDRIVVEATEAIRDATRIISSLKNALERISKIEDRYNCGDWDEIEEARKIANEELSKLNGEKLWQL